MPKPIHILLADDHWVVRAGLHALLDRDANLRVVGEAATAKVLVEHQRQPRAKGIGAVARLSAREREVLGLTAEGHTSTEIGKLLRLSPKSVDTYRARVMDKLGLKHRSELVRFALRAGLLKNE